MRLLAFFALILFLLPAQTHAQTVQLPKPVVAAAFVKAECDNEIDEVNKELEFAGALSGRLKLLEVSCWRAAYNFGSIFFAVDPENLAGARLLQFQTLGEGNRLVPTHQLSNPAYDEKKKVLESFHKGRGIGDCGTAANWRWNGKDFALVRYWSKDDCDGEPFFDDLEPNSKYLVYPPRQPLEKRK
jgi:hypothetical protein